MGLGIERYASENITCKGIGEMGSTQGIALEPRQEKLLVVELVNGVNVQNDYCLDDKLFNYF
jgi:hypothetical protein